MHNTRYLKTIRDIYGFRRPTQWVDPASILKFDEKYKSILARQEAKWDAFLQEHQGQFPPLCAKRKHITLEYKTWKDILDWYFAIYSQTLHTQRHST